MNDIEEKINQMPQIKTWNGQRVVTFKDIDIVHQRKLGTARRNFNTNKKHFIEGIDYIVRNSYEAKHDYNITAPNGLTLITESGYLMIVKSFTDDLSWSVQRQLVNSYFRQQQPVVERKPDDGMLVDMKLNDLHKRLKELEENKFTLIDLKLNDLHKRVQALEKVDKPKIHLLTRLTPKRNTWYQKNRNRIWRIRRDRNMELRELYHIILEECEKCYDLDEAEGIYRDREGSAPTYAIDLVEYFPELQDIADQVLDCFESEKGSVCR